LYRPWKSFALNLGYQSLAAFPIKHQGRAVGVFNLYASEVGFFDDEEVKLLDEMAMDISFAFELNQK
jgi:GAF domain-containing protein